MEAAHVKRAAHGALSLVGDERGEVGDWLVVSE